MDKPPTLETTLHRYRFDTSDPRERTDWVKLCNSLKNREGAGHLMNVSASPSEYKKSEMSVKSITLETKCLFDNQWNSTEMRVFDWYEAIFENRHIKEGHYLDITPEMIAIRHDTEKCGFCGAEYYKEPIKFCSKCLGNEYLKESDLHLLRLMPISWNGRSRPALVPNEREIMLLDYYSLQVEGKKIRESGRFAKMRENVTKKYERATDPTLPTQERDGFIWMLDRRISIDNCIFYTHKPDGLIFSFGWRTKLAEAEAQTLRDAMQGFPFDWNIKEPTI